ncbi:MAG TPA: DUF2157 domain-containing protein [Holophagaceae bacterium]|nr:DUF2157 domain-containing protein [Holophagaceae bacterium]
MNDLEARLASWRAAGVLDDEAVSRIQAFELAQAPSTRLRWPVIVALVFGALMIGAGVLLFVAAHWDEMSPAARFTMLLSKVAFFHAVGAFTRDRSPRLSSALHGIGTAVLGAAIFLAAQAFNLQSHWPSGILMWAAGAVVGWLLLDRDWVQGAMAAILIPFWLGGEWSEATGLGWRSLDGAERIESFGFLLLAITYLSARRGPDDSPLRKSLAWIGGLALIPSVFYATWASDTNGWDFHRSSALPVPLSLLGWTIALTAPLGLAFLLKKQAAKWNLLSALWAWGLGIMPGGELPLYAWCALGAAGLIAWGVHESRRERINLGMAGFAITLFAFYFSSVMDKLGRSLGLMGLGFLFLAGGWQLERLRRRLNARISEARP